MVEIAVRLFGEQRILDSTTRAKCFSHALEIWQDAHVARSAVEIEYEQMLQLAEQLDALRTWDDPVIRSEIWLKIDSQSGEPGQTVAVTSDAIRKHLIRVFGTDYGNALFYAGRHFGVSRTTASSLRELIKRLEGEAEFAAAWRKAVTIAHLAPLIWHPSPSQPATLKDVETWIVAYLRNRAPIGRKNRHASRNNLRRARTRVRRAP